MFYLNNFTTFFTQVRTKRRFHATNSTFHVSSRVELLLWDFLALSDAQNLFLSKEKVLIHE
jgi:hypothetical protein